MKQQTKRFLALALAFALVLAGAPDFRADGGNALYDDDNDWRGLLSIRQAAAASSRSASGKAALAGNWYGGYVDEHGKLEGCEMWLTLLPDGTAFAYNKCGINGWEHEGTYTYDSKGGALQYSGLDLFDEVFYRAFKEKPDSFGYADDRRDLTCWLEGDAMLITTNTAGEDEDEFMGLALARTSKKPGITIPAPVRGADMAALVGTWYGVYNYEPGDVDGYGVWLNLKADGTATATHNYGYNFWQTTGRYTNDPLNGLLCFNGVDIFSHCHWDGDFYPYSEEWSDDWGYSDEAWSLYSLNGDTMLIETFIGSSEGEIYEGLLLTRVTGNAVLEGPTEAPTIWVSVEGGADDVIWDDNELTMHGFFIREGDSISGQAVAAISRLGYTLVGWKGSKGKVYTLDDQIPCTDGLTLTAQWEKSASVTSDVEPHSDGSSAPPTAKPDAQPAEKPDAQPATRTGKPFYQTIEAAYGVGCPPYDASIMSGDSIQPFPTTYPNVRITYYAQYKGDDTYTNKRFSSKFWPDSLPNGHVSGCTLCVTMMMLTSVASASGRQAWPAPKDFLEKDQTTVGVDQAEIARWAEKETRWKIKYELVHPRDRSETVAHAQEHAAERWKKLDDALLLYLNDPEHYTPPVVRLYVHDMTGHTHSVLVLGKLDENTYRIVDSSYYCVGYLLKSTTGDPAKNKRLNDQYVNGIKTRVYRSPLFSIYYYHCDKGK